MGSDADLLVAAAWLHDVGYTPSIAVSGFHPLDGARYLASLNACGRLCALVANHSGAYHESLLLNLAVELSEFPDEKSLARDGLWYADMTTSPDGLPVTFDQRFAELQSRYGVNHRVPIAIGHAADEIRRAISRVKRTAEAFDPPAI